MQDLLDLKMAGITGTPIHYIGFLSDYLTILVNILYL